MWFFDSVLEEAPKATTPSPVTKKDEQDGSFLIIDDSVRAETLPDTAVQLFDTTPVAPLQETSSASEVSFFSEPAMPAVESSIVISEMPVASSSSEIAFFDESTVIAETVAVPETNTTSDALVSFTEETLVVADADIKENNVQFFAPAVSEMEAEVVVQGKDDIYAPLKEAIAKYDTMLGTHMKIADIKDVEIVTYNTQIAEAKEIEKQAIETAKKIAKQTIDKARESSKIALEERKALETEMDRVRQMKELFSLQLAK